MHACCRQPLSLEKDYPTTMEQQPVARSGSSGWSALMASVCSENLHASAACNLATCHLYMGRVNTVSEGPPPTYRPDEPPTTGSHRPTRPPPAAAAAA